VSYLTTPLINNSGNSSTIGTVVFRQIKRQEFLKEPFSDNYTPEDSNEYLTVLFLSALIKYCAPWRPIRFSWRFNLVSTYKRQSENEENEVFIVTSFASIRRAKYSAPSSSIWLFPSPRLMRLSRDKKKINKWC
jgi:hypothetical protein